MTKWNNKAKIKFLNPQSQSQKASQQKSGHKQIVALPIVAEDKIRV